MGNQEIEFYAGQVKRDSNNQPIVVSERPTLRLMDLFVMDGAYYFANQSAAQADAQYLPARIADTYLATIESIGDGDWKAPGTTTIRRPPSGGLTC